MNWGTILLWMSEVNRAEPCTLLKIKPSLGLNRTTRGLRITSSTTSDN